MPLIEIIDNQKHGRQTADLLEALDKNDLQNALSLAQRLATQNGEIGDCVYLLSETLSQAGLVDEALTQAERACALENANAHFSSHLANCLLKTGRFDEALSEAERALQLGANHILTYNNLGSVFTGCGELTKALAAYECAVELEPKDLTLQYNLATSLRGVGRLHEAELIYDQIIDTQPNDWEAYRNRSDLKTQTETSNHIAEMESCLHKAQNDLRGAFQLLGALAKELSDIGQYEKSFTYLKKSTDIRRGLMNYDVSGDVETMRALANTYGRDILDRDCGYQTDEPIFIVGLPRTGTTLVERMLGSHSDVFAAGELQNFAVEFVKLAKTTFSNQSLDKLSLVDKSTQLDFAELGKRYISSTRPRTGRTPLFIDKLPLNFLYVGLIHLSLPKARIIHLTRHPMDACYAIFKTPFSEAYPYSYSLSDLARYYIAYRRLMDHWHTELPDRILDVPYEDLVQNPETQIRRILDYCALDWQDGCLNFHENTNPTNTASAAQVRQPIYTSSVAKWRHVEAGLLPLRKKLESAGIAL
jgi:tetratricopeptide (TPR) repeat protein